MPDSTRPESREAVSPANRRLPDWLKVKLPAGGQYQKTAELLDQSGLQTVCHHARCPNLGECYSKGTATFLMLGPNCSRNCRYCHVESRPPCPPDPTEPGRIARAVRELNLSYAVITAVTRDDLPDGGAGYFAAVVQGIRQENPGCLVELLIPDFLGCPDGLQQVMAAGPDVLGHNLETVEQLFAEIRPLGSYRISLDLLQAAKSANPQIPLKSGIMVGLGETAAELHATLADLAACGVELLTIGQYLQPGKGYVSVKKFYEPAEFIHLKQAALNLGFKGVAAGPLVRSSYHAGELYHGHPDSA